MKKIKQEKTGAINEPEKQPCSEGSHENEEAVEIHQGSAHSIQAENVNIRQGGVQLVESDSVTMSGSSALSIRANDVRMEQSGAGIVSSSHVELNKDSFGGLIIAERVDGPAINARVLLASDVYGNVQTAIDMKSAALLGIGIGVGLGLLLSVKTFFKK